MDGIIWFDMTIVALVSVAPVREGSMASDVARAIDAIHAFDVSYETNPMGTVIKTDDIDELFGAVKAAHEAVECDRVSTFLKIDEKRSGPNRTGEKVERVEAVLGRPAKRDRSESK